MINYVLFMYDCFDVWLVGCLLVCLLMFCVIPCWKLTQNSGYEIGATILGCFLVY